jgi:bacteriocin biosynthesis cyclodehydratase domain-containing protein
VLRRDLHSVQLGLDWPGVAVLPDTPALRAVLGAVDGLRDTTAVVLTAAGEDGVDVDAATAVLDTLIDCGAVVDLPHHLRGSASEPAWASDWLLAGRDSGAPELAAERERHAVEVWGRGQVADGVRELASRHGLRTGSTDADVVVVASDHEPPRTWSDQAMADGRPHLWVAVRELVGVLGPFVDPGSSACLRCVDRARGEHDPCWHTLVESAALPRLHVHACDPLLAALVATWAVQEVVVWASGLRPQTSGQVLEIPLGVGGVESVRYQPHPSCGCGWPVWQDTMGA